MCTRNHEQVQKAIFELGYCCVISANYCANALDMHFHIGSRNINIQKFDASCFFDDDKSTQAVSSRNFLVNYK